MVLELLPGGTLDDQLRDGLALPDVEAARIAGEIAAGLAHAHERGLVHRDLKPANVLFDADGRAKIADFGIARIGGAGTLTEAGTLLGTAAYISPEQAAGEPATAASDVYSFGVMLFRMLTGRLPFEADEPLDLVALHRDAPPPPVARFRADPPPRLARLADASLAKDPAERPPDGRALAAALGDGVDGAETATMVLAPPRKPARIRMRRGRAAALVLALLAIAGTGTAFALLRDGGSSEPAVSSTKRTTKTHSTTRETTTTPTSTTTRSTSSTSSTTQPTSSRRTTTAPVLPPSPPPPPPQSTTETLTTTPTTTASTTTITLPVP
jgi:eukaryotic-like serine/threonine-protein kinase